jgi:hypothetical protein
MNIKLDFDLDFKDIEESLQLFANAMLSDIAINFYQNTMNTLPEGVKIDMEQIADDEVLFIITGGAMSDGPYRRGWQVGEIAKYLLKSSKAKGKPGSKYVDVPLPRKATNSGDIGFKHKGEQKSTGVTVQMFKDLDSLQSGMKAKKVNPRIKDVIQDRPNDNAAFVSIKRVSEKSMAKNPNQWPSSPIPASGMEGEMEDSVDSLFENALKGLG